MKKQVVLFALTLFIFFGFVIAQEDIVCELGDDNCKIDKAYSCLRGEIDDKGCDNLSPEEKVFSLLATGKCKAEVLDDSRYKSDLKYTSQAILGFKETGSSSSSAKSWLFGKNRTSIGIDWFLEIESPEETTCTVDYSSSNDIVINEDKTINSLTGGSCLSVSANGYWIEVSSDCYDEEFTISCDKQFLTTLLYQKQGSDTIYVSEKTSSASAEGTTKEKVESLCFGGNDCDYEGTLWASLALSVLGIDVVPYLPYLITMAGDNVDLLPEAFLYSLTGNLEFKNQLLIKQINNKWWVYSDDRYFGTALALYPLQYEEPSQKKDSVNWLLNEAQEENGCWDSGNIRNTAFILYSISPKSVSSVSSVGCEGAGYFCVSQINCLGEVLSGYSCSGAFVCCSEDLTLRTCSEQGGEICNSNQECVGVGSLPVDAADLSTGQLCCTGGACQERQAATPSNCEVSGGTCRINSCLDGEETSFESCDFSSDICCVQETKQKTNYAWIWILLILIALATAGIIFRDRLRPYWFRIKSKFDKSRPSSRGLMTRRPGIPPAIPPPSRRMATTRRPMRGIPRAKSRTEIDDVLKKLKEMGKQ